jgi:hypothetical protein
LFSTELSGDSEEEETMILNAADVNMSDKNNEESGTSGKNIRNWYPSKEW